MRKSAWILTSSSAFVALGSALWAQAPQLGMIDRLARGNWSLSYRDDEPELEKVCLAVGKELIQLRHARLKCHSTVVDDTANETTVQYTCPGNGYGRTHIRRESDHLAQVDTQGIENGLPFAFSAEARWVGACQR